MAKAKRLFLRLFVLLLLVAAIAVVAAPFVPLDALKPAVEARLSQALGRQVTVGSLRLSLFGGPYLHINQMTAKEDPAFGDGDFLRAEQVRANFSAVAFALRRRVEIDGIKIESPDLTFTKNPQGVWSWATLGKPTSIAAATTGDRLRGRLHTLLALAIQGVSDASLKKVSIEGATVRLTDGSGRQPETLYRNVSLEADTDRQSDRSSRATGRLKAQSDEAEGAALLRADMPFDLTIDRSQEAGAIAKGKLGPGAVETKNFAATDFTAAVDMKGDTLALAEMNMNLYDGSLRGNLELNLASQQFSAEGEVQNLNLDEALSSKLQMAGQITGHVNARFKLGGLLRGFQEMVPTIVGGGRVSSTGLFIASVNLSEQVASALKLGQIGDMGQGTKTGALEADFQVEQGVVRTSNLQIQQLDGLGDATSDEGWFKVEAAPTLSYAASLLLSNDATAKVKTTSPIVGAAVSLFEVNNRIAVPVNIAGDVRQPQVQVDVRKFILGF